MKPPTFEELLKRATGGTPHLAATHIYSDKGNICTCGEPRASEHAGYTKVERGSPDIHEARANAELIVRLLAFANAGGVDFIKYAHARFINPDTARLLSILDGAAVPGSHYEEKK